MYIRIASLLGVFALAACSNSGAPAAPAATIATLSLSLGTPSTKPDIVRVFVHAYAPDGSELTGPYPAPVTVTQTAGCNYAIEATKPALLAELYLLPVVEGGSCPNTSASPAPSDIAVTSGGSSVWFGGNGGPAAQGAALTASSPGAESFSYALPSTGGTATDGAPRAR